MKKLIKYIAVFALVPALMSCEKQLLDKEPLDIISDAQVWDDPSLIDAYLVNLYHYANTRGIFNQYWGSPYMTPFREIVLTDEARLSYNWNEDQNTWALGLLDGSGGMMNYWPYNYIRQINEFLLNIESGNADEDLKTQRIAEARFLRAFTYFEMVKRYGGVPLITVPQELSEGDALFVRRNTEKEIWEFVLAECDAIAPVLPDIQEGDNDGRASKYTAVALKSRAMLYAASEAKYGQVELDGLVGVPTADEDRYWQESYDASKAIVQSGLFQLYNQYEDKAENYQRLFLDEGNEELIFVRKFEGVIKGHPLDYYCAPESFKVDWGNSVNPNLEMVDSYEMIDGSSGAIDWANVRGIPTNILKNKDPRFHASIFYNGQPWQGDSLVLYDGILADADGNGVKEKLTAEGMMYNGMLQVGKDACGEDGTKTGFLMKKFLDPDHVRLNYNESGQDWIIFRYGEILLNLAEAALELGKPDEALDAVNQIRNRAGIAELASIDIDRIRQERKIELAFETHRWWDLKRWRLSVDKLNGTFHGLAHFYDFEQQDYVFEVFDCNGFDRNFKLEHYHMPISEGLINNNPNLVENPGY